MSDRERLAIEDKVRNAGLDSADIGVTRANYELLGTITPIVDGVTAEPGTVAGLPVEYLRPSQDLGGSILFFHGGGYMIGSLNTHRGLASHLALSASATVIAIDYRLAPEHVFPAASDDCLSVYRALLEQGYAAEKITLAGDSAGGALVVATLMGARDAGLPLPAAAFLMSPFVDLTGSGESGAEKVDVDVVVRPGMIEGMGGAYLNGASPDNPKASPLFGEYAGLPPLLVHVGTYETILDDSLRLVRKAAIADVAVELKVWPKMPHVFQLFAGELEEGRQSLQQAGSFLRRYLG
ncbi:MAG: alpha/beta hydrolase [Sphingobium sp.]|nr:MAG: alpha/beta hydrolase [Sphingobium sp.]